MKIHNYILITLAVPQVTFKILMVVYLYVMCLDTSNKAVNQVDKAPVIRALAIQK